MKLGRTILRVLMGALFIGHGTQKLFGWFGGHGLDGTAGFFESLGFRPGRKAAIAAGASEAGGGALLAAGLLTPLASAALIGTMSQAIETVHVKHGPWVADGGWEYNAILIAAALTFADEGPGDLSLDHKLGLDGLRGPVLAALALAGGLIGPRVLLKREPAPEEQPAAA